MHDALHRRIHIVEEVVVYTLDHPTHLFHRTRLHSRRTRHHPLLPLLPLHSLDRNTCLSLIRASVKYETYVWMEFSDVLLYTCGKGPCIHSGTLACQVHIRATVRCLLNGVGR